MMCRVARRVSLLILLPGLACGTARADEKSIFSTSTEQAPPDGVRPSAKLAQATMDRLSTDEKHNMSVCLADQGIAAHGVASLLRRFRIADSAGRSLWFVRPALEPYCMALYGAHIFTGFLFEKPGGHVGERYRLRYKSTGDAFSVYRRLSHGLNDVGEVGCSAMECRTERLSFDGTEYRPTLCSRTGVETHGSTIQSAGACWTNAGGISRTTDARTTQDR